MRLVLTLSRLSVINFSLVAVLTSNIFSNAEEAVVNEHVKNGKNFAPFKPHKDGNKKGYFEGDIIPIVDEIRKEYGKKMVKKLRKDKLLPKKNKHDKPKKKKHDKEEDVSLGDALTDYRWTTRKDDVVEVPYAFRTGSTFSSSQVSNIKTWMAELEKSVGVIKFVERTSERNYVMVQSGRGCSSYVGNVKRGAQPLTLQTNGCVFKGTVQHEFIHALGFYHEQSRADRDNYVTIHAENIPSGVLHNFAKRTDTNTMGSPYDFGSVMHYGATAFSTNGRPTISSKNGASFGQRSGPSTSDIEQIRLLYQCKSGFRTLSAYKKNLCTSDCPCWEGATGCSNNDSCQGSLVCNSGKCAKTGGNVGGGVKTYTTNWWSCFDKQNWCYASSGYMTGMWRNDNGGHNDGIYRIEQVESKDAPQHLNGPMKCYNRNWWSSFDRKGWSTCHNGYYMAGLYRTTQHWGLHNIEEARCCRPTKQSSVRWGKCYVHSVWSSFDHKGWSKCNNDHYMTGMWRNDCNLLYCIEYFYCCKMV